MTDKPVLPADSADAESMAGTDPNADGLSAQESEAILALRRERDDVYSRLLRTTAEFDNYRKRIERERREQADLALTDLLIDLLQVVDNFDRALRAEAGEGAEAYRRGVELIHKQLHDLLRRRGITPIDALGADFDPRLHQAVVHEVSPDHREGEVVEELQRGYMLGDRLLRPAMVKVAKA